MLRVQVIRNTFPCTLDDSALSGDGFTIAFKGHSTSSLAFDASGSEVGVVGIERGSPRVEHLDSPAETVR